MANITPITPSIIFSYWRPWDKDSNFTDSYFNYVKDVSLAKYSADTVGKYISEASQNQVLAINELGQKIGIGINILSRQLSDIHTELKFLNKKLDIQIEQQKITDLLLENIGELLRVPDSEKERQHSIELGLKFFLNAQKDEDLFTDALEELLKAEKLMKQDYFVLHRIGLIYLYSIKHIDPQKALDYFTRAAKYAGVESDPRAAKLANILTKKDNGSEVLSGINAIQSLAADSYEKAAFAAYVLGDFELAVTLQAKAAKCHISSENRFLLAKYQVRANQVYLCLQNLSTAIDEVPSMVLAVFKDLDLLNEPGVLNLIELKNGDIDKNIHQLRQDLEVIQLDSLMKMNLINELGELLKASYDKKVERFKEINKIKLEAEGELNLLQGDFNKLKMDLTHTFFLTLENDEINLLIKELDESLGKSLEVMRKTYEKVSKQYENDRLKVGSKYAGGIVFHIDETGKHGMIAAEKDQGTTAFWGKKELLGTKMTLGSGKTNTRLIMEQSSWANGFLFKENAARICARLSLNGYNDWFLPSKDELYLMYKNLHLKKYGHFANGHYWSSSEENSHLAWCRVFHEKSFDYDIGCDKKPLNNPELRIERYVRAVRAF